jgi:hypothetical protein
MNRSEPVDEEFFLEVVELSRRAWSTLPRKNLVGVGPTAIAHSRDLSNGNMRALCSLNASYFLVSGWENLAIWGIFLLYLVLSPERLFTKAMATFVKLICAKYSAEVLITPCVKD